MRLETCSSSPTRRLLKRHNGQFEDIADQTGLRVLGWREVPRDSLSGTRCHFTRANHYAAIRWSCETAYGEGDKPKDDFEDNYDAQVFERQLYVFRKRATHIIGLHNWFYLCSLSNGNIVYKGQLSPVQVYQYYHDLGQRRLRGSLRPGPLSFLHQHISPPGTELSLCDGLPTMVKSTHCEETRTGCEHVKVC